MTANPSAPAADNWPAVFSEQRRSDPMPFLAGLALGVALTVVALVLAVVALMRRMCG